MLRRKLEAYFEFEALGATWKTEILAGFTTFMTMAYIVFVNPSILHETGMPLAGVTAATCLSAAVGSFLMGALARYPIALAPGMGLNAYFTYSVVKGLGVPWQTALGCCVSFRPSLSAAHRARIAAAHSQGDSGGNVRGGGGRRRPFHRAHRISQLRHRGAQRCHYGDAWQSGRSIHRARAF